jgi:hypothetical protein
MGKLRTHLAAAGPAKRLHGLARDPKNALAARVRAGGRSEVPTVIAATLVLGPPGEQCGGLARSTEQRQLSVFPAKIRFGGNAWPIQDNRQ